MTVEERITILKLALRDAAHIVEQAGTFLSGDLRVVALKQILNQMVYARIEEWGENQVDVPPEVTGTVEDAQALQERGGS